MWTESEKVGQPKEMKVDLNKYRTEVRTDLHSKDYQKTDQFVYPHVNQKNEQIAFQKV